MSIVELRNYKAESGVDLSSSAFNRTLRSLVIAASLLSAEKVMSQDGQTSEPAAAYLSRGRGAQLLGDSNRSFSKLKAMAKAHAMIDLIEKRREELGYPILKEDPLNPFEDACKRALPLFGVKESPLTSTKGSYHLKLDSLNDLYCEIFTEFLHEINIKRGDEIVLLASGSLPASNIYFLAACEAVRAKTVLISSAASSQWGANLPGLTWLEMQNEICKSGKFAFQQAACSLGGVNDSAGNVDDAQTLINLVKEAKAEFIDSGSHADPIEYGISRRMEIIREKAPNVKLIVNIGGGRPSSGGNEPNILPTSYYDPVESRAVVAASTDCVLRRAVLDLKIPVLNIRNPRQFMYMKYSGERHFAFSDRLRSEGKKVKPVEGN